jgi:hypothetical protein
MAERNEQMERAIVEAEDARGRELARQLRTAHLEILNACNAVSTALASKAAKEAAFEKLLEAVARGQG